MATSGAALTGQTRRRQLSAQLSAPLRRFLRTESGGAALLVAAAVTGLLWANSPWSAGYEALWHTELAVRIGDAALAMDLGAWINDGLLAVFFFVIGLELRRQLSMGELTDRRKVTVPLLGAMAGLALPAAIYLGFNPSGEAARGWGVAMATDTAFVLGALALIGPRFPGQLRVFLLSLAVVDDVGALAAIAIFYSDEVSLVALAVAAASALAILVLGRMRVWRGPP